MEKRTNTFRQRLFGGVRGAFAAEPMIVLHGEREAIVYGCRRILLYTPPQIRLSLGKRQLVIEGNELSCSSFSGGAVTVEGVIDAVWYEASDAERKRL